MPSNNPAFGRGFARAVNGQGTPGQGPAGWGGAPQTYGAPAYGAPTQADPYASPYSAPSPYAARKDVSYMTMDDVVTKTGISFLVTVVAAAVVWALPGTTGWALAFPAAIAGFIVGMVISFRLIASPIATLSYAALQGVFLGAVSEAFNLRWPGIVTQAVIGTFGVFAGMLVIYKTGAIRVTPKFTRWIMGALIGALVLMVANMVAYLWSPDGLHLRDGGPVAIIFSLVVIGIAAFSLLVDFDMADEAIRRGAPAKFAWYIAFGLLVTVVWLYLEILRLLSYLRE